MSEQLWWYATRAAGLMTWFTATAAVVIGLLLSLRVVRSRTGAWMLDLHRFLGGISVLFLAAHMGTLWADTYVDFGPKELLIPGASAWETEAMAWGIIAAYVLIAVEITSLLRRHIGRRVWWTVHIMSIATVVAGGYHAWLAGSDVDNPVTWAIAGIGTLLVLGLVTLRLQRREEEADPTGMRLQDRESILLEMRQRLEELPVPETTPQPQLEADVAGALPRRSPLAHAADVDDQVAEDPFTAVPPADEPSQPGSWVEPPSTDPFTVESTEVPPVTGTEPVDPEPSAPRFRARPFTDTEPDWNAGEDRDPFASEPFASEPFTSTPTAGNPVTEPVAPIPSPAESAPVSPFDDGGVDLFASGRDDDSPTFTGHPFNPVTPPTSSITAPPTAPVVEGPPPLPTDAVDPETGEPDEAAYTEWLKEWLVYAEQYGDSTPEDPSRV